MLNSIIIVVMQCPLGLNSFHHGYFGLWAYSKVSENGEGRDRKRRDSLNTEPQFKVYKAPTQFLRQAYQTR